MMSSLPMVETLMVETMAETMEVDTEEVLEEDTTEVPEEALAVDLEEDLAEVQVEYLV